MHSVVKGFMRLAILVRLFEFYLENATPGERFGRNRLQAHEYGLTWVEACLQLWNVSGPPELNAVPECRRAMHVL